MIYYCNLSIISHLVVCHWHGNWESQHFQGPFGSGLLKTGMTKHRFCDDPFEQTPCSAKIQAAANWLFDAFRSWRSFFGNMRPIHIDSSTWTQIWSQLWVPSTTKSRHFCKNKPCDTWRKPFLLNHLYDPLCTYQHSLTSSSWISFSANCISGLVWKTVPTTFGTWWFTPTYSSPSFLPFFPQNKRQIPTRALQVGWNPNIGGIGISRTRGTREGDQLPETGGLVVLNPSLDWFWLIFISQFIQYNFVNKLDESDQRKPKMGRNLASCFK